ncbi:MAG: DUF4388 domain-containing protein, partial [PVC group bacterium]|nr:DUF4388 domain-containing protein [PVC group bacterium]
GLFSLLTWDEGDLEFEPDVIPEQRSINTKTKPLLKDCLEKSKELNVIKEVKKGIQIYPERIN